MSHAKREKQGIPQVKTQDYYITLDCDNGPGPTHTGRLNSNFLKKLSINSLTSRC